MTAGALLDLRTARAAARTVAGRVDATPAEVTALRLSVAAELPGLDEAARTWTRLGHDLPPATCRVIGRTGWVEENLRILDEVIAPLGDRFTGSRAVARQVLGAQVGTLLGLLSTRVLGQYVLPLTAPGTGQLVVVGPNLLVLARQHGRLADDLRRTVVLHELAHRLQFEAVGWLGEHLRGLVERTLGAARLDPDELTASLARLPEAVAEIVRTRTLDPLLELLLPPEQAAAVEDAQAFMSVLEGHGNATMHLAADGVVDDPAGVKDALEQRRGDLAGRLLRAVAGMERKARQYTQGEAWVRGVVDRVGVDGLNQAFADPSHLPRPDEVLDPDAWVARVVERPPA